MADDDRQDWEAREDRGELLAPVVRADGSLLVEGVAAREGVLEYRRGDSIWREYVPERTLVESAAGLARAPLTLDHPDPRRHPDGVTPDNVGELLVGDVDGEVAVAEGGFVRVRLAVRRRDAIDAVSGRRKRELSAGYRTRLDRTPGVHPVHGRYDAVQVERQYNHLSIVERGRAGPDASIRTDAAVASARLDQQPRMGIMNPRIVQLLSLFGVTSRVDSDDAALDAVLAEVERRKDSDDGSAAVAAEKQRADAAEAKVAELTAALAKLTAESQARADAAERTQLLELGTKIGLHFRSDAALADLRKGIAQAQLGGDLPADRADSAPYVQALIDAAARRAGQQPPARAAGEAAWQGDAAPVKTTAKGKKKSDRWGGRPAGGGDK